MRLVAKEARALGARSQGSGKPECIVQVLLHLYVMTDASLPDKKHVVLVREIVL